MAQPIFWSAATGGFYDPEIHGAALPSDAVPISRARHAELLAARAQGDRIVAGRAGRPEVRKPRVPLEQLRRRAIAAVKAEARRRILAIASLERQANDNSAIAMAALSGDHSMATEALLRRGQIDFIRSASNRLEAVIATMPAANLPSFDAGADRHWSI